jgi:hypothetical protein
VALGDEQRVVALDPAGLGQAEYLAGAREAHGSLLPGHFRPERRLPLAHRAFELAPVCRRRHKRDDVRSRVGNERARA